MFYQGYWCMSKSWFGIYNISLIFEKSLYKKLVKISRGFEILEMIHQSPKVLTKTRIWDFIKISWEFWSETLYMASIYLEDRMFEVLIINFEGKWINWFKGAKWSFWSKSGVYQVGLLVNHQFKHPLFIFHTQIHLWIMRNGEFECNLFKK